MAPVYKRIMLKVSGEVLAGEKGVGFDTSFAKVPLVCQSCIYDLGIGSSKVRPDKKMGYEACKNAFEKNDWSRCGNVGAGTGATCGKAKGNDYMSEEITVKGITEKVEQASTTFEKTNTDLKRRYILWMLDTIN